MAYGLVCGMAPLDIVLSFFLIALLYSGFGQTMPKTEVQPEFLELLENHTVTQGRDVSFTCVVNHLQSFKVAWIKSDSRAILAIHTHMIAQNPRLSVTHNGHNTWKLHVTNVQPNDSGTYMCQVNTDPMRSLTGHMKVVIPPDIMDSDDSSDLTTNENSDLRLQCNATGTPQPTVTWRREDGRNITLRTKNGVKRVKSYEGERLNLVGIVRQEMGSYLCIASNGVPPTVSKRYYVNVLFKPLIKVPDQLVSAPVNSKDVVLQCYVEASPRALNTWYGIDGVKLLPDENHELSEVAINDYAYQLNLTIKRLDRSDFGSYACSAENAFGKAEGAIRLQELHLPRTTISPLRNTDFFDKYGWGKQGEKKGKLHSYVVGGDSSKVHFKNGGHPNHTTPSPRNNSVSLDTRKSKVMPNQAPASAPAHFTPTAFHVPSNSPSYRSSRFHCIRLMMIVAITVASYW